MCEDAETDHLMPCRHHQLLLSLPGLLGQLMILLQLLQLLVFLLQPRAKTLHLHRQKMAGERGRSELRNKFNQWSKERAKEQTNCNVKEATKDQMN